MSRYFAASHILVVLLFTLISSNGMARETTPSNEQVNFGPKPGWPKPVEDNEIHGLLLFDLLEYRPGKEKSGNWDILGWRGGDIHRIWIKSEGEVKTESTREGIGDFQLLYGKLISPYFDLQAGVRAEQRWSSQESPSRFHGVIGLQGLALYMYELDVALYVSQAGEVSARLTASQDYLLTQRVITQIRLETNAAIQRVEKFSVGSGLNDLSLDLRARYEFRREFAPYIGISWANRFGETAEFARNAGREPSDLTAVTGLRMWY